MYSNPVGTHFYYIHIVYIGFHMPRCIPHLYKLQRAHIPKTIIGVLEKKPGDIGEEDMLAEAKKVEDEKLSEQETLYQVQTGQI